MSETCEDRDGRAGGATMLQPVILRLTLNAAAFAAARPTLLFTEAAAVVERCRGRGGWDLVGVYC